MTDAMALVKAIRKQADVFDPIDTTISRSAQTRLGNIRTHATRLAELLAYRGIEPVSDIEKLRVAAANIIRAILE